MNQFLKGFHPRKLKKNGDFGNGDLGIWVKLVGCLQEFKPQYTIFFENKTRMLTLPLGYAVSHPNSWSCCAYCLGELMILTHSHIQRPFSSKLMTTCLSLISDISATWDIIPMNWRHRWRKAVTQLGEHTIWLWMRCDGNMTAGTWLPTVACESFLYTI